MALSVNSTTQDALVSTNSERINHLRLLIPSIKTERSNIIEALGGDGRAEQIGERMHPWVFGEQALLPRIIEVVERGTIDVPDYMNIVSLFKRHLPFAATFDAIRFRVDL
jgi:hypothetical protein